MPRWKYSPLFHDLSLRGFQWLGVFLALFCYLSSPARVSAEQTRDEEPENWLFEATNNLGAWIWETNALNKQTVRFWKAFEIPAGAKITNAILRITVDNGYTLFLDGREIGRGSDWRTVTKYDVTHLLSPGRHVVKIEGFNDRLEGGLIFGLHIDLAGGRTVDVDSDKSWFIVPAGIKNWLKLETVQTGWHHALVVGHIHSPPWQNWPFGLATVPPLHLPEVHFWQRGWFQLSLAVFCLLALLTSVWLLTQLTAQSAAQDVLEEERVRIARDIHDDLGAQLTQLVLLGEVAQREEPADSAAQKNFVHICAQARELSHALDEVVWTVNSRRDTLRDLVSYLCKYAQIFLNPTPIRCRLDVEPDLPATPFDLPVRRNLLLAVKEALNNAAKYSQAAELFLRIYRKDHKLNVVVEDNGQGFDPAQAGAERNGLTNMAQRMNDIGGICELTSQPGSGCLVRFAVPLHRAATPRWRLRRRQRRLTELTAAKAGENGPAAPN